MEQALIDMGKAMLSSHQGYSCYMGENSRTIIRSLNAWPHAFVLACLMDRQMNANAAWSIPLRVGEALGDMEFSVWNAKTGDYYLQLFKMNRMHRYPHTMAQVWVNALEHISRVYDGDASRIWAGTADLAEVIRRFRAFPGCGDKIASMAANILVHDSDIQFYGLSALDISADVHVVRTLVRMGLIEPGQSAGRLRKVVLDKARQISPAYPGILDLPIWMIGRTWCKARAPLCDICPMGKLCRRHIQD